MKTTDFYNKDGQIKNPLIAEEVSYIEKPYREAPLSIWQKFISSRATEIMIGDKKVKEHLEEIGSETSFLEKKRIADEEKARINTAISILYDDNKFRQFLAKLDTTDFYFWKEDGHQSLSGKIEGLSIEITHECRRKFAYKSSVDGKRVYDYYWVFEGSIEGMDLDKSKCALIMEKYKKQQEENQNTIRGICLSSYEQQFIKLMKEGNFSLQKFQKSDRDFKVIGTIGDYRVSLEGFSKKNYTENQFTSISGHTESYIDGKEISTDLSSHIWGMVPLKD